MTEQFNPSELYVWGPDGEYLEIPLSADAENTEEQPVVVQWDSSGILRLEALSAAPRGWRRCPNDPPCPHPGVVHDIDVPGGVEQCCEEGCGCGKSPATPGVAGPPKDQT